MAKTSRTPFQGVANVVRFNWHFYALAALAIAFLFLIGSGLPAKMEPLVTPALGVASLTVLVSLAVTHYVYDRSDLYTFQWLDPCLAGLKGRLVNIHAGFDETSPILAERYPGAKLTVFDFYDPAKHTEVSIERARRAYPAFPGTAKIDTQAVPLGAASCECVLVILSAHEIRNHRERTEFFHQLGNALTPGGRIIVTEHLRDAANFAAYTLGCFHFLPRKTWERTFEAAGLTIDREFRITPFITTFILRKHGPAS